MKLDEAFFPKALRDYVDGMAGWDHPIFEDIARDTHAYTPLPQMIPNKAVGALLHLLVKISQAQRCLEIGTFTGSSAIYLASALPVDGKLITLDKAEKYVQIAQKYFQRTPFAHKIECIIGDALETLDTLEGQFDLIFIDADKSNYPAYYEKVVPLAKKGGLIIIDDVLWRLEVLNPQRAQARNISELNQRITHDPRVEQVMLTVRDGLLLCRKK